MYHDVIKVRKEREPQKSLIKFPAFQVKESSQVMSDDGYSDSKDMFDED